MKTHITTSSLFSHHSQSTIQLIITFLLLHLLVAAQEAQPEIRQLMVGETLQRKVSADEEVHGYAIEMKRGQVLRVTLQEQGADVNAVMIRASDQQKASAASNFGGGFMRESLTLIADRDGVYALAIKAQRVTDRNIEATYELSTALKNTASQNDIQRVKAETLMEEGSRLFEGNNKTTASLAVTKFEESIKIWNLLADDYWAEIAKGSMGSALVVVGNFAKAEFYLNQVLRTFTDSKNEPAVALTLVGLLGLDIATQNEKAASQHLHKALEIYRRLGDRRAESLIGSLTMLNLSETNSGGFDRDLAAARAKDDKVAEASLWAKRSFHYVVEEDSIADEEQRAFFEKAEREALPLLKSVRNRDIELQICLNLGIGFYDLTLGRDTDEADDIANKEKSISYISHAIVLAKIRNNPFVQSRAYDQLNLFYDGDNDRLAIFFRKKAINSLQDLKQDFRLADKETQQLVAKKLDEEVYSSFASELFFEGRLAEAHQVLNLGRDQEYFDLNLIRNQGASSLSLTSREIENEQLFNRAVENIAAKYSKRVDDDYQLAEKN